MKKFILSVILLSLFQWSFSQVPGQNYISPFREIKTFNWKTTNGLPYVKSFSGNYSVEVFKRIDKSHYAFLSKSEHALLIFNMVTGQKEKTIHLPFTPVDFSFSQGRYYVAGIQNLYLLSPNGEIIHKWFFGNKIKFVNSIKVIDNKAYLMTSNQKTWFFDQTHSHLLSRDGILLKKDLSGEIIKQGSHRFSIILSGTGDESFSKTVDVKKPLGTIRILGMSGSQLFVEVQTILNEVPLKVKRDIRIYQIAKSRLNQVSAITLPDVYYTYIKHDVNISDSYVDILISTPENARIYQMNNLEKAEKSPQIHLPAPLYEKTYLYNNHLLPALEGNSGNLKSIKGTPITRQKIIQNAEPYATHKWYCNQVNIRDYDCGGTHVRTPSWVTVGNNISVPYMWGGFSSLQQFDQGLKDGVSAGDSDTHGNGAGSSCAVGVDCSGFVSRAWGLGTKYCTRCIPDISTQYASYDDLRPGDVVNYAGHHVRLIHTVNGNGSFLIIEASASGTNWRVGYNEYTTADFQGKYLPRHYNNVTNGSQDNTAPTTAISVNKWETADFEVNFTDHDNTVVQNRFYQVSYFDGANWFANNNDGFFNDNFTNSTQWKTQSGNWTIRDNTLNQSVESNSNTNIYALLQQDAGSYSFLYEWRMKIGGSGDNRRAGIHFMCDGPTQSQRKNSYMIYFRVDNNTCQIYKSENNSIHLKTSDACVVNANEWFDAKVIFNSATGEIDVFKNDKLVSVWIDATPLTSGNSISLRTGNANVSYDDMKVYRSRTTTATVTTGAKSDLPFQNPLPDQPACLVLSVVADSMHNLSAVDSAFVNIDWTKPSAFTVNDGISGDIDSTHEKSQLSANWTPSKDANSGIVAYYCCVGTAPDSNNLIPWFNNGSNTQFTKTNLSLKAGDTCYVAVTAVNAAGLSSDTIVSDGVVILQPAGIPSNNSHSETFHVYPNPANEMLWVKTGTQVVASQPKVYELSGKQLMVTVTKVSENLWKINLKTIPHGLYFVRIKTKTGYLSRKFLVTK